MVFAYALLLGVEAHALADYVFGNACRAPNGEGHFEANGEDSLVDFAGALAKRMRRGVEARRRGRAGRIVAPHVEALHGGG